MGGKEDQIFDHQVRKKQERLDQVFGKGTLLSLRKDCCDIYEKYMDNSGATPDDKTQWMLIGRYGITETRNRYIKFNRGLDVVNFIDAFAAFLIWACLSYLLQFFGFPGNLAKGISAISSVLIYSLNSGLLIAKALVTELAYTKKEISPRLSPETLYFRASWNKTVIQSSTSLFWLTVFGIITTPGSRGYELGLNLVERWVKWRYAPKGAG